MRLPPQRKPGKCASAGKSGAGGLRSGISRPAGIRLRESQSVCMLLRDMPGKQPPCLHERIIAGQRTANGISRELAAVSREWDRGREFPCPIGSEAGRPSCYQFFAFLRPDILTCAPGYIILGVRTAEKYSSCTL